MAELLILCLYHSRGVALLDTLVQQESSEASPKAEGSGQAFPHWH